MEIGDLDTETQARIREQNRKLLTRIGKGQQRILDRLYEKKVLSSRDLPKG